MNKLGIGSILDLFKTNSLTFSIVFLRSFLFLDKLFPINNGSFGLKEHLLKLFVSKDDFTKSSKTFPFVPKDFLDLIFCKVKQRSSKPLSLFFILCNFITKILKTLYKVFSLFDF